MGIRAETTKNLLFEFVNLGYGKLLSLVTTIVLARLLVPADFGVVAAAYIVLAYLDILRDFGVTQSLIQRVDRLEEAYDSGFVLVCVFGVVEFGAVSLFAFPVAGFFQDPRLAWVLIVLSTTLLTSALAAVPLAILHKALKTRVAVRIQMVAATVNVVVSIAFAVAGLSYWSLVAGVIAGGLVLVVLVWRVVDWRPRLRWSKGTARELMSFGAFVTMESVFWAMGMTIDNIIVGRLFGLAALGIYTVAFRLGIKPNSIIAGLFDQVLYPVFTKVGTQKEKLREAYLTAIRYVSLVSIPTAVGMFLLADYLVLVLLGPSWVDVVPLFRILVFNGLFRSMGVGAQQLMVALGRPGIAARVQGGSVALLAALIVPAALLWGSVGVAMAVSVTSFVTASVQMWIGASLLGFRRWVQIRQAALTIAASLVMAVVLWVALGWVATGFGTTSHPVVALLALILLGAGSHISALVAGSRGAIIGEVAGLVRLARASLRS